jgi:hypothetical protein
MEPTGFYRVYENGDLIAESPNVVTTLGKKAIADHLAGIIPDWAGSIAVGVGSTTATSSDKRLVFETTRSSVSSKVVSYGGGTAGAHRIIVKATLDPEIAGTFSEMGVFSLDRNDSLGNYSSTMISFCDSTETWQQYNGSDWIANPNSPDTTNEKNGIDAVALTSAGSAVRYRLSGLDINLAEYASTDLFLFAAKVNAGSLTTMVVRFNTDDSNYYTYTTPTFATGTYGVVSYAKSNWTAVGSPSWGNITSIEFTVTGTGLTLMLDGIRIEEVESANPDYVLVSRSVLGAPIVKSSGSLLEVEYYLDY